MHHLVVALVIIVGDIVFFGLVAWGARALGRRMYAGEPYDDWQRVRRELSRRDRLRVMRATNRQVTLDRPDLEQAQLVYVRFSEHALERSPLMRHPRTRFAFTAVYVVLGLGEAGVAVTDHGAKRVAYLVFAIAFVAFGVLWASVVQHSVSRRTKRMVQMRRQMERGAASSAE
jgi:hypothetical protein